MKIAIAKDGEMVAEHFGQCVAYDLYIVEDSKVTGQEYIESPGHAPGMLPKLLADHGANIVIAGGMGPKAVELFHANDIEVILGVTGTIKDALESFIKGKLESGENVCHH